ncbi:hypothetical protein [Allomesorhizobium camelthorni]|uniref:hypothetical protein n=1 Tax=Allomesorhizobium camelthorni TaxID=475069 RepID=UPI0019824F4E|nr:hypothetical protein [Mesorhizobium camelthorni]
MVEIQGARDGDDKEAETMRTLWVPGVNALGAHGRWNYKEFKDVWTIASEFAAKVEAWLDRVGGIWREADKRKPELGHGYKGHDAMARCRSA